MMLGAAMLVASQGVFAQVKIGSNPTVINPANNLEVESTDPTKKISINKTTGKLTIADGSQGDTKILTSDANGVATWQSQSSLAIPVTVFNGGNYS
jgi:N-acetylglucosamine-6-phosphate deacetylase